MDAQGIARKDLELATRQSRWSLQICGLWPEPGLSRWKRLSHHALTLLVLFMILAFYTLPQMAVLSEIHGDLLLITDNMTTNLNVIVVMIKLLIIWYHKEALTSVVVLVNEDWMNPKTDEERGVMLSKSKVSRIISYTEYLLVLGLFSLNPTNLGQGPKSETDDTDVVRPLLVRSSFPYDTKSSPNYELTYMAQITVGLVAAALCIGVDTFFQMLVLHVCGQLENLGNRMERLTASRGVEPGKFQETLKAIVENHMRQIRFADEIENSFNVMLLALLLICTGVIVFQGFLLLSLSGNSDSEGLPVAHVIFFGVFSFWNLSFMFVYCFVGEMLSIQSEGIYQAAYNIDWFTLEPKDASNLISIIARAQVPLRVTAGKFCAMNMPTFSAIVNSAASYISVLLAMRKRR